MTRMLTLLMFLVVSASACIEKNFDEPPVDEDIVELVPNATIADIKEYYVPDQFVEITEALLFDAVVIADDQGGNFYKRLVLQDETGGIEIQLNRTDLYTEYQEGRKLFVHAQGLFIADFNGVIQLGAAPVIGSNGQEQLGRIDNALISTHIQRGAVGVVPLPQDVTISELAPDLVSTLVTLHDVQFVSGDTSGTYADVSGEQSLNLQLEDCDFNTVIVRTSNFASFAADAVPNGKGSITGVYGIFGDDSQLLIRRRDDVLFDRARCEGATGGGGGQAGTVTLSVEDVRNLYAGGTTTVPTGNGITGIVISDQQAGSTTGRNMVVQQDGYGIVIRFEGGDFHTFNPGDEVFIDISGVELSEFNGLLQLNEVPLNNAVFLSGNNPVVPVRLSVNDILSQSERYESTLVEVVAVTLSPDNGDWERTTVVTDATGSIDLYTQPFANFAGDAPPTDTVDLVAIVGQFNNVQLSIRNLADVSTNLGGGGGGSGSGGGDALTTLSEDFESQTDREAVALSGWTNFTSIAGGRTWQAREFSGNKYAQVSAFNDSSPDMDTWLITPKLDLAAGLKISFATATAFYVHQGLEILVSTDWDGSGDPAQATWIPLSATLADASSGDNNWITAVDVPLIGFSEDGYVAFHYTGSEGQNTSTFRVDNVVVSP